MSNPQYFRLTKYNKLVGFKRVIIEYLPVTARRWQLGEIDHDPNQTVMLTKPPLGIASLKRPDLKGKQERESNAGQGGPENVCKE